MNPRLVALTGPLKGHVITAALTETLLDSELFR